MKTFEEKYTAWLDGKLTGPELADFEKELAAMPDAAADKRSARRLGDLLRRHGTAPRLMGAEFFNHQLMRRIEAETEKPRERATGGSWFWPLPRLVWAGAFCLLLAGVLFKAMIPSSSDIIIQSDPLYFAEIIEVRTPDPSISATTVYDPRDNVTVLWLEGLDYLPASYKLQ